VPAAVAIAERFLEHSWNETPQGREMGAKPAANAALNIELMMESVDSRDLSEEDLQRRQITLSELGPDEREELTVSLAQGRGGQALGLDEEVSVNRRRNTDCLSAGRTAGRPGSKDDDRLQIPADSQIGKSHGGSGQ
jgi:hypothetical protein